METGELVNEMAGCVVKLMGAPCDRRRQHWRVADLTEAMRLRAEQGLLVARDYLVELCRMAEHGKYTTAKGGAHGQR